MLLTEMFGDDKSAWNTIRADVEAIAKDICPTATLYVITKVADGDVYMTVSMLKLPKDVQKKGFGSAIMKAVCDYADRKGIIVALSPTSEFGTGKATLVRFYKAFGFKPNTGGRKNFLVMDTMIRYPK